MSTTTYIFMEKYGKYQYVLVEKVSEDIFPVRNLGHLPYFEVMHHLL